MARLFRSPTARTRWLLLGLVPLLAACGAPTQGAGHAGSCTPADPNSVTVVIDYADLGPAPTIGCAYNLPDGATGLDALVALKIPVTEVTRTPQFICRLDGYPTPSQVLPIPGRTTYTEACQATPPQAAYWTYWYATPGGDWTYSTQGYAAHQVTFGGFEGYGFAHNTPPAQAAPRVPPR